MHDRSARLVALMVGACVLALPATAQQFAYPAKGQTAEQQKKDEAECGQWATGQTGADPSKPAAAAAAPAPTPTGVTPGAGARGAARGAIVGGMVGDSGAGAAAGAAAGRAQSRRQNASQQQQAQQTQGAQSGAYMKARAACLEGRGYTVK